MKLHELYEGRDIADPKMITAAEFDALPGPKPGNIEGRFKIGKVAFDNEGGLGNTPNGQNVNYLGFTLFMLPSAFLELATPADREADALKFQRFIEQRAPIATPMLYVTINELGFSRGEPLRVKVTSHEGRGRARACQLVNGETPLPVEFIPGGGLRARDFNPAFFEELKKVGIIPQAEPKDGQPLRVTIHNLFWMNKEL